MYKLLTYLLTYLLPKMSVSYRNNGNCVRLRYRLYDEKPDLESGFCYQVLIFVAMTIFTADFIETASLL